MKLDYTRQSKMRSTECPAEQTPTKPAQKLKRRKSSNFTIAELAVRQVLSRGRLPNWSAPRGARPAGARRARVRGAAGPLAIRRLWRRARAWSRGRILTAAGQVIVAAGRRHVAAPRTCPRRPPAPKAAAVLTSPRAFCVLKRRVNRRAFMHLRR